MKKYIFLIIMGLTLTLLAILAGPSLAAYYPGKALNMPDLVHRPVGSPEMVLPWPAIAEEAGLRVEYSSDQAIQVPLPEAYLQKQLDLVLEASPFGEQDRNYERNSAPMCPHNGLATEAITPAPDQSWKQTLESLHSTVYDSFVISLWHPSSTATDYKLVVDQDADPELDPSVACPTSTEENQVEG